MKILVVGTWRPEKAKKYETQAYEIGKTLAQRNHTLLASPSEGIQGLVAKAYKENGGKEFIGYYPSTFLMEEVGEKVLVEPDSKILTEEDYPVRNVYQVRAADAILGISGASGTFMEMLLAVNDYQLPAAYYEGSSWEIDNWLKTDKLFQEKVYEGKNVLELITYLESSFRYLKSSF